MLGDQTWVWQNSAQSQMALLPSLCRLASSEWTLAVKCRSHDREPELKWALACSMQPQGALGQ